MLALDLLLTRSSRSALSEPGPDSRALDIIFKAALRAPDHKQLKPWRFITIEKAQRDNLGQLFVDAALLKNPQINDAQCEKLRKKPLRAPLIITVVATVTSNPKVPEVEQVLSAGCAAHSIVLAAQALGFGAIWRTGPMAYNENVERGLGLVKNEKIIGFIYVGSISGDAKRIADVSVSEYVTDWSKL